MTRLFAVGALRAALALAPGALTPLSLRAQEPQQVVLQHGFMSNSGTWDRFAPWIENAFSLRTSRYNTGSNSPFSRQANKLREFTVHLPDTTIFVGHSNGGVIIRHLSHMRPMKGFITVGTPQRGAPLAASVLNGSAEMFAQTVQHSAAQAADFYNRIEFDHYKDWLRHVAVLAASGQDYLGRTILGFVQLANAVDDFGETVLTDMNPDSYFFTPWAGLNSFDALQAESRMLGDRRVAITTQVTAGYFPQWMIWKGIMPGASAALSLMTDAVLVTLIMAYDHYASYYEPDDWYSYEKQASAHLWLWAAAVLGGMDMSWCALIGAGSFGGCEPADGIVPVSYQRHPDPNVAVMQVFGPAHQEQTSAPSVHEAARRELETRFQVGRPEVAAHPLAVSIDGSWGTSVGLHTNTAYAVGGTSSYSYRWYVSGDGNYFEDTGVTTPGYTLHLDVGQMFWIRVVVTSGTEQASDTKVLGPVCVDICS